MAGSATPMMDVSRITMNWAAHSKASAAHLFGSGINCCIGVLQINFPRIAIDMEYLAYNAGMVKG